ncbi:MAG: hypothetical protein O2935_03260 [Proteobacteria bacterium]|nr:hypothetical protein [Pseudomonadota bacterium]
MTLAKYIKKADYAFNIKGSADELLNAAKEAFKVEDKIILKEILVEMKGREQNRMLKKKRPNPKLTSYIPAVEKYFEDLENNE